MLCNIKPVPFHESDKHIFAKIPGGGRGGSGPPVPPPHPLDLPMYGKWLIPVRVSQTVIAFIGYSVSAQHRINIQALFTAYVIVICPRG